MKNIQVLLFLFSLSASLWAQDPELLMNEARFHLIYHKFQNKNIQSSSIGPAVGFNYSFFNLIFSDFNKRRFRLGDIVGGGVCPIGYTNSPVPEVPIYIWARFDIGVQAYYAVQKDLDIGCKFFWYMDVDWDRVNSGLRFQPVIRYRQFLAEGAFGSNRNKTGEGASISLKYIFLEEDAYYGIFLRFENTSFTNDYTAKQWSLGYSMHFANNR